MSDRDCMTKLQRAQQRAANRIAEADAGMFDAVEAFFEPYVAQFGLEGEGPDESLDSLWKAYIEKLEAIDGE